MPLACSCPIRPSNPECHSTSVERALQITLFLQNKANSRKPKIAATPFMAKDYKENSPRPARKNKPNQTQSIPARCMRRCISGSDRQRIYTEVMREEKHGQDRQWYIHGQDGCATFQRRHSAFRTIRGGICWGLIGLLALSVQLLLLGYQPIVKRSGFIGIFRFLRHANIIAPTMLRKALQRFHPPLSGKTRPDLSSKAEGRRQNTGDRGRTTEDGNNGKVVDWRLSGG